MFQDVSPSVTFFFFLCLFLYCSFVVCLVFVSLFLVIGSGLVFVFSLCDFSLSLSSKYWEQAHRLHGLQVSSESVVFRLRKKKYLFLFVCLFVCFVCFFVFVAGIEWACNLPPEKKDLRKYLFLSTFANKTRWVLGSLWLYRALYIRDTDLCIRETDLCIGNTDLCIRETDLCIRDTDLCIRDTDLCIRDTDLCIGNIDLCIRETDICIGNTDLYIRDTNLCIRDTDLCIRDTNLCIGDKMSGENVDRPPLPLDSRHTHLQQAFNRNR